MSRKALTAVALVTALLVPADGWATLPGTNGRRIAITVLSGDEPPDVHLVNLRGRSVRNLTPGPAGGFAAGPWSPDGASLLVVRGESATPGTGELLNDADIYLLTPETGELVPLTETEDAAEVEPAWAPDGSRIAFTTRRTVGTEGLVENRITVMGVDGTGRLELADGYSPSWSPDGTRIAYTMSPDTGGAPGEIATMSVDGADRRILTTSRFSSDPDWSPDGDRIVFSRLARHRPSGTSQWDVFVMTADGGDPRRLTNTRRNEGSPHWSPDGRRILFGAQIPDDSPQGAIVEVFELVLPGGSVRRVTRFGAIADSPYWRPR